MLNVLLVAFGGALGSILRYGVTLAGTRFFSANWPYGTFFVNVTGSFAMGVAVELIARRFGGSNELRLFVATGLLGGYTTFSSFTLDTSLLWERGASLAAMAYLLSSVMLGMIALFAGLAAARHFG
ncbi:fluoride efflux transporter CrcB [Aureimonas pseudogalii]|uniref:Fluoride-specific ion channel FluC n=1 Tax=Aureimonas pseudogalii TaxID=1744844 RepID=A0A7W6H8A5_9HYPH|nr:fluoride efflux transporter CrcB [Aureimonas pseudogalii]MBB4000387.1 CrcB protein [Aureimonas pseudogalii]